MTASAERSIGNRPEVLHYESILKRVPDAVSFAKIEAETSKIAKTPEGKFALAYLLANRNLLKPVLSNPNSIPADLLQETGGPSYNPERSIDGIGSAIALYLSQETAEIPHFFMRTEESLGWESLTNNGAQPTEGERFAVIDPLDMTSSIPKGDRVQTTGVAIYDRQGNLKTAGIVSLVDDGFIFVENNEGHLSIYPTQGKNSEETAADAPIRVATLVRRMYSLKDLPVLKEEQGVWTMGCTSGYAVLGMMNGQVDTIIDPIKGNPWYEVVIWGAVAQALGFPMSDKEGNPIDISQMVRRVIERHEGDTYRIPFVISRTPEIHQTVLPLLKPNT